MADTDPLSVGVVVSRTVTAIREQFRLLLVLVAIDAAPHIALDFTPGDWTLATAFLTLLTLYLQLLMTIRTTALWGRPTGYTADRWTEGGYPGAFALSLVTVVGVLAGLVALVVPGLLLFALWSLSLPALVAERLSVPDAMRRSWRLVRPRLKKFVPLTLIWSLPFAASLAVVSGIVLLTDFDNPWLWAGFDLAFSILLLVSPIYWAVVYLAACDSEHVASAPA